MAHVHYSIIRSSRANRLNCGFTLIELLIVSAVLALVLSSICGIYLSVADEWQRQDGRGTALASTSMACTRISDYLAQAVGVVLVNRFATADALAVNLPANRAHGIYVPTWNSGKIQYQSGLWIIFYLSDSTGSYSRSGDILWAATMNWGAFPRSVAPDPVWSLYYDQPRGKIEPISSLRFATTSGAVPTVTMTVTSTYKSGQTESSIQQRKTICLQNAY